MKAMQLEVQSHVGRCYLVASENGVRGLFWAKQNFEMAQSLNSSRKEMKILVEAVRQVGEYFEGQRRTFDLALDLMGTEFQKNVWNELTKIPYGETCSYGDIAKRLKNEKAVRAVGAANGRNPISIIIPCHRVVGANGTLTGYAGGLTVKSRLLELEKRNGQEIVL